jgi:hypothetical protein
MLGMVVYKLIGFACSLPFLVDSNKRHMMDEAHSHMFMTSSKVTQAQRKRVLQNRYGLLPTNKLLYRYKR